jgi:hypothetical protein
MNYNQKPPKGGITFYTMKKALQITGKIIYFIVAMSPIFALGYMLGIKLMEQ